MNRRLLTVAAILVAWGVLINCVPLSRAVPLQKPLSRLPARLGDWEGSSAELSGDVLKVLGVTDCLSRHYRRGAARVEVYVGYYDSQGAGRQIHSPKHCLPGGGWTIVSQQTREINLAGIGTIAPVEAVYEKDGVRQLFVYWYRMKGADVTNDYLLKWRMILNSIRYRRNEAAFVRLSTAMVGDERQALAVIEGFIADFLPRLQEHLPP
jgi:EpsI family protein